MNLLTKEKDKKVFVDDGRVIADMSLDGMPGPMFRRKIYKRQTGQAKESDVKPSRREYVSAFLGVLASYLVFGLVVFGSFALFILFCIKVWFK